MDPNESPETCALRELKEETGYIGELVADKTVRPVLSFIGDTLTSCLESSSRSAPSCSMVSNALGQILSVVLHNGLPSLIPVANACLDPGFCNTNLRMIHVTVDMSRPENQNPQPELEDNEFIETFSVPLKDLWQECIRFEQEGYAIDARVGTLAEGIEFAKRWRF